MCLAIPAQVCELVDRGERSAVVDVLGVRRQVSIELMQDDPVRVGDWVLVHVGFAMSKISAEHATETLQLLAEMDETSAARAELDSDDDRITEGA